MLNYDTCNNIVYPNYSVSSYSTGIEEVSSCNDSLSDIMRDNILIEVDFTLFNALSNGK